MPTVDRASLRHAYYHWEKELISRAAPYLPASIFESRIARVDGREHLGSHLSEYREVAYDQAAILDAKRALNDQSAQAPTELFVCRFRDAYVHSALGLVNLDGRLVAESALRESSARYYATSRQSQLPPSIPRRSGLYATVMIYSHENYFHWLIDVLPRLYLIAALGLAEPIKLLVCPSRLKPYQLQTLEWLLPAHMSLEYAESDGWTAVEELIFPSFVRTRAALYLPRAYADFVRQHIFEHIAPTPRAEAKARLYISRANASLRRVSNEAEVVACLSKFGFEVVHAEKLPFEQQVRLFSGAEFVVAPHGAGLTNTLFCDHVKIVEMMMESTHITYQRLAWCLGHEHHLLTTEQKHRDADMRVDIPCLEKKLIEIGA